MKHDTYRNYIDASLVARLQTAVLCVCVSLCLSACVSNDASKHEGTTPTAKPVPISTSQGVAASTDTPPTLTNAEKATLFDYLYLNGPNEAYNLGHIKWRNLRGAEHEEERKNERNWIVERLISKQTGKRLNLAQIVALGIIPADQKLDFWNALKDGMDKGIKEAVPPRLATPEPTTSETAEATPTAPTPTAPTGPVKPLAQWTVAEKQTLRDQLQMDGPDKAEEMGKNQGRRLSQNAQTQRTACQEIVVGLVEKQTGQQLTLDDLYREGVLTSAEGDTLWTAMVARMSKGKTLAAPTSTRRTGHRRQVGRKPFTRGHTPSRRTRPGADKQPHHPLPPRTGSTFDIIKSRL